LVAPPVLPVVWTILPVAAVFQAIYFWGVMRGYRTGDFTVVYPLSRSLPGLFIALSDVARGHAPSVVGWLGIVLVTCGCMLIPLDTLRGFSLARYRTRSVLWALVIASGIVGYTLVDSTANRLLTGGAASALSYNLYETSFTLVTYAFFMRFEKQPVPMRDRLSSWRLPAFAALLVFASYSLILWAYQLTPFTSYVAATRQVSIVIGAVVGAFAFREPAPLLRISAAIVILSGVACIALA
jgi:drug/metabolite transporter (DMT)-like permease